MGETLTETRLRLDPIDPEAIERERKEEEAKNADFQQALLGAWEDRAADLATKHRIRTPKTFEEVVMRVDEDFALT